MRLLITTDTVGGVWRFGLELVTGLLESGDAVALVSFGKAASTAQHGECDLLAERWKERFSYIPSDTPLEWMSQNDRCMDEGMALLGRTAREFGAELMHSSQFCFGAGELGIPKIVTAHSDVLGWGKACRKEGFENTDWLRRYRILVQRGLLGADSLTAPTEWMLQSLGENFELPQRTQVIANGCAPAVRHEQSRTLRAVTAARLWDEAKDVSLMSDFISPIPLAIAGATDWDGVQADRVPHAQYFSELSYDDVLRLFATSAIYICTSRYEPFGLSPIEAALCGCAVLARDIDSLHEVWGEGALYFADAGELSKILWSLAKNPELLHVQQQRAGAQAQMYTRQRMVNAYRALYASLTTRNCTYVG